MQKINYHRGQVLGDQCTYLCDCENNAPDQRKAVFRCRCGNAFIAAIKDIKKKAGKRTVSCGCHRIKSVGDRNRTHGMSDSPEFSSWKAMTRRCLHPTDKDYPRYGGRGISICERWALSFENFYKDMGPRPEGTSIERLNVNGDYEPSNCKCKWGTAVEQANNKRSNILLEYQGSKRTVAQWADELKVSRGMLYDRVDAGWPIEDILFKPSKLAL